jgi:hypothetical protein
MEWVSKLFDKLFDAHKLPITIVIVLAMGSGGLLFLPPGYVAKLRLDALLVAQGQWIGLTFLVSSSLLFVKAVTWIWKMLRRWMLRGKIRKAIKQLDHAQKAVLREFFLQEQHVIELPIDHPNVVGLLKSGILETQMNSGMQSTVGILVPCRASDYAAKLLKPSELGWTVGRPSQSDLERLMQMRPPFARELDRHNHMFGR